MDITSNQIQIEKITSIPAKINEQAKIEHDPFVIDGNGNFQTEAINSGWLGNGSATNPYRIENLSINGQHTITCVIIRNTDVFFIINNCFFTNGSKGIWLENVYNGIIQKSSIENNLDNGIHLQNSENINLINNSVTSNIGSGIYLLSSPFCKLITNNVSTNSGNGITIWHSDQSIINDNNAINNNVRGIFIENSANSTIAFNEVHLNNDTGLVVSNSYRSRVYENNISKNAKTGMDLFSGYTGEVEVYNNSFIDNQDYGLQVESHLNNTIVWNEFITNNPNGLSQASDDLSPAQIYDNIFQYNYWFDLNLPDDDFDGYVDIEYPIDGTANNYDPSPLSKYFFIKPHDPITIMGDNDLKNQALISNWKGNGTQTNPYLITNWRIDSGTPFSNAIEIKNTSLYFTISNCLLSGQHGVLLHNVSNSMILKNNIFNCNTHGIYLIDSSYNVLQGNRILYTDADGITLSNSDNNTISNNVIHNSTYSGIYLTYSNSCIFINNDIQESGLFGLYPYYSSFCEISNNRINTSGQYGLYLFNSDYCKVTINEIFNSLEYGIYLRNSFNTNLKWNKIIDNYIFGSSQAYSSSNTNFFSFNYWNEWTTPDSDGDGIVDVPYSIDGSLNNEDKYPLVNPAAHLLLKPSIIHPNGGEKLSGSITIEWTQSVDSLGHTITFSIYHSSDGGNLWIVIDEDLTITTLNWETTTVSDGSNYLIKIVVNCSEGLTAETILVDSFTIDNIAPDIVLINPQNETTLISLDTIELSITDYSLENVWYNWDDGMNQSLASPYQIDVPTEEGYHWLTVYATDFVGHITVQKYGWFILIPTTTTTTTTSTTSSISTPSTTTIESTTTSISAPKITPVLNLFPFLMGLLVIVAILRRLRR